MKKAGIVIAFIVGLFLILSIGAYNSLVRKQENVAKTWSLVENVCQRRADLVPNLVALVKSYDEYEQRTLVDITEARAKKAAAVKVNMENYTESDLWEFQATQDALDESLNRLMVSVEDYPDLKANENYLALQAQLAGCENRILTERERFNDAARDYNQSIRRFPRSIIANMFGFEKRPYFEAAAENADTAPKTF